MNILVLSEEYVKSGHHDMDSLREQPTPAWSKIGYQGICWYVPAGNATLRSECKLNESPPGASSQYQELGAHPL